jgi:hypothetical protein
MACLKNFIQIIVKTLDTRRRDFFLLRCILFPSFFHLLYFQFILRLFFFILCCMSFFLSFHFYSTSLKFKLQLSSFSLSFHDCWPTTFKDVTARKHQIQNCSHVHDRLNESLLSCQGRKFNHEAKQ